MPKLAEILKVQSKTKQGTVYINPANVSNVEEIQGGTVIVLMDGSRLSTSLPIADVVGAINQAML